MENIENVSPTLPRHPEITLCTLPIVAPGQEYRYMDQTKAYRQPRLGVQAIRDYLVENNFPKGCISFLDIEMLFPSDEKLEEYFVAQAPDIVGLSAPLSHSYLQVKRVASIIRSALPNSWIVLGGHLTASAAVVLKKTVVDVCIVGDGEVPFYKLVNFIQCGGTRETFSELGQELGISYLDKEGELAFSGYSKKPPNESIAMPDYEFFKSGLLDQKELVRQYFLPADEMGLWFSLDDRFRQKHRRPNTAQVPTTKGCTARCTFCQRSTKGYRLAGIDDIETHLLEIIEKYDVGFIDVFDENFGGRREQARAFADLMAKYDLLWTATGVRCVNVTREDIAYFKERGCCSLKFGVESGSQAILDLMEKNFTKEDVEHALTSCWEHELFSPLAMMVGMPGETEDTIRETGEWIGKMGATLGISPRDTPYALFYALPFPGTPLYNYCIENGFIYSDVESEEQYLIDLATRSTNKWSYLNVNAAKPWNVLTWDLQVRWIAAKTYLQMVNRQEVEKTTEFSRRWKEAELQRSPLHARAKASKNRRISLLRVEQMLERAYLSKWFLSLPRWVAIPVIKGSYFSTISTYVFLRNFGKGKVFDLYSGQPKTVNKVYSESSRRLDKSLRNYVNKDKKSSNSSSSVPNADARNRLLQGAAN